MITKFTVHVTPKNRFLAKEVALWFIFKRIDYIHIHEEVILAQVPIELISELGMIASITVKHEHQDELRDEIVKKQEFEDKIVQQEHETYLKLKQKYEKT
jgi:hypothetical protein